MNLRLLGYEPSALPNCATPRRCYQPIRPCRPCQPLRDLPFRALLRPPTSRGHRKPSRPRHEGRECRPDMSRTSVTPFLRAATGNRTRVFCLGSRSFAIKLQPRRGAGSASDCLTRPPCQEASNVNSQLSCNLTCPRGTPAGPVELPLSPALSRSRHRESNADSGLTKTMLCLLSYGG